jgi:hypothetical protein
MPSDWSVRGQEKTRKTERLFFSGYLVFERDSYSYSYCAGFSLTLFIVLISESLPVRSSLPPSLLLSSRNPPPPLPSPSQPTLPSLPSTKTQNTTLTTPFFLSDTRSPLRTTPSIIATQFPPSKTRHTKAHHTTTTTTSTNRASIQNAPQSHRTRNTNPNSNTLPTPRLRAPQPNPARPANNLRLARSGPELFPPRWYVDHTNPPGPFSLSPSPVPSLLHPPTSNLQPHPH